MSFRETADAVDVLVGIGRTKCVQPAIKRYGIIVKKGYDGALCLRYSRIPCSRQPSATAVSHNDAAIQGFATSCQEWAVVINDYYQLVIKSHLFSGHVDCVPEYRPAVSRIRTDYYCYRVGRIDVGTRKCLAFMHLDFSRPRILSA
jgi:hypothetical protein